MLLKHESNSNSQAPLMMVLTNATDDSNMSQISHRDSVHVASSKDNRSKVKEDDDDNYNNDNVEIKYSNSVMPATQSTPTLIVQPTLATNNATALPPFMRTTTTTSAQYMYNMNINNNSHDDYDGSTNHALPLREGRS